MKNSLPLPWLLGLVFVAAPYSATSTEPQLEQMCNILFEVQAHGFGDKTALSDAIVKTTAALFQQSMRGWTKTEKRQFLRELVE